MEKINFFRINNIFYLVFINILLLNFIPSKNLKSQEKSLPSINNFDVNKKSTNTLDISESKIYWEYFEDNVKAKDVIWEPISENLIIKLENKKNLKSKRKRYETINSFNRSIVFDNQRVGPDISWLVPPGLAWNKKYKFDASVRGHNRREKGENFFGWNGGDAVGQFYYQPLHWDEFSFGLNLGMRSIYEGPNAGGSTSIGEGLSAGLRFDHSLSETSGIAFGAEQLLHFDGLTDTGRDLYITASKGFWLNKYKDLNYFPIIITTAGIGTGKMAEGNVKGLCSDLLGGSGTETRHQRRLCWAPIFSIATVFNEYFSTFFEYNSKFFLLGTSYAPSNKIPLRGTFAVQISDHIENYKINNIDELKWVFRLSLGF